MAGAKLLKAGFGRRAAPNLWRGRGLAGAKLLKAGIHRGQDMLEKFTGTIQECLISYTNYLCEMFML